MDCVFCKIIKGEIPAKKIYEDDKVIAILDINPLVDGHVLVIPKKHFKNIYEIDNKEFEEVFERAKKIAKDITKKLNSIGVTFQINYGYNLVDHFHIHLLPDFETLKKEKDLDTVYDILTK